MSNRQTGVPNATAGNLLLVSQRMVEIVNRMQGLSAVGERVIRVQELVDLGVLEYDGVGGVRVPAAVSTPGFEVRDAWLLG